MWRLDAGIGFLFFLERQSMFKVVFTLQQIVLRLKESQAEVLIKKHRETLLLGSHCQIVDGICSANLTTQFYVGLNDTSLNVQVIILQSNQRKLGGNTVLNLLQWQPNVLHQTISILSNSPDKQAKISFSFYYFKDNAIIDKRHLFLSSERFQNECQNMEKKNLQLTEQNKKLERELDQEERRNEALLMMRQERESSYSERERAYMVQIESRQKSIEMSNQECEVSKQMREELQQLVKDRGLVKEQDD